MMLQLHIVWLLISYITLEVYAQSFEGGLLYAESGREFVVTDVDFGYKNGVRVYDENHNEIDHETGKNVSEFLCIHSLDKFPSLANVFPNLETLRIRNYAKLRKSGLKEVTNADLRPYQRLSHLNLCFNSITTLPSNLFDGLYNLKEVDLRENNIKYVAHDIRLPKHVKFLLNYNVCIDMTGSTDDIDLLAIFQRQCEPIPTETDATEQGNGNKEIDDAFLNRTTEEILHLKNEIFQSIEKMALDDGLRKKVFILKDVVTSLVRKYEFLVVMFGFLLIVSCIFVFITWKIFSTIKTQR